MSKENYEVVSENTQAETMEENNKFEMVEVVKNNKKRIFVGATIAVVATVVVAGLVKVLRGGAGEVIESTAEVIENVI